MPITPTTDNPRGYAEFRNNETSIPNGVNASVQEISQDVQQTKDDVQNIIDGTTAVGAQQPAIADADGTLADLTTKFNLLLAAARTRGEIAS